MDGLVVRLSEEQREWLQSVGPSMSYVARVLVARRVGHCHEGQQEPVQPSPLDGGIRTNLALGAPLLAWVSTMAIVEGISQGDFMRALIEEERQ
jgi:hypothetical protein